MIQTYLAGRRFLLGPRPIPTRMNPGVVGKHKFTFDVWGDAVNTASLMEANGMPGRINVSETVAGHVKTLFELEPRGSIVAKHERAHEMFFLNRLKPEFSRDPEGRVPNEKFVAECNRLLTGFSR